MAVNPNYKIDDNKTASWMRLRYDFTAERRVIYHVANFYDGVGLKHVIFDRDRWMWVFRGSPKEVDQFLENIDRGRYLIRSIATAEELNRLNKTGSF